MDFFDLTSKALNPEPEATRELKKFQVWKDWYSSKFIILSTNVYFDGSLDQTRCAVRYFWPGFENSISTHPVKDILSRCEFISDKPTVPRPGQIWKFKECGSNWIVERVEGNSVYLNGDMYCGYSVGEFLRLYEFYGLSC